MMDLQLYVWVVINLEVKTEGDLLMDVTISVSLLATCGHSI